MALSEAQFKAVKEQLAAKKARVGDTEYSTFIQRAAQGQGSSVEPEADTDGFVADVGQGLAKSAGELGLGLGTIGRGIQKRLPSFLQGFGKDAGETGESVFDPESQVAQTAQRTLARDTAGEKVGGFIGDVASFALPGGAAVKATKGVNFLTRAATLGASDALVTTARQGEFDRDSVDSAIIGAAFPVVGKVGSALKGAVLPTGKDAGGRVINSLIKPLLKDFSYGKNPGQAVAEAGITANSLDDLAVKISKARSEAGEEIASKISGVTTKYNASDALTPLNEALEQAKKNPRTNATIIKRLEDTKLDLLKAGEDGLPTRDLTNLSADEMWEFNKEIGDLARWTDRGTDDEVVNRAIQKLYRGTREKLDDTVDGLKPLSEKYANLKTAEQATIYRDKIAARQGLISFSGAQLGGGAALATALTTGGAAIPALLVGAGVGATTEAMKSPAVKTRVASWLATASKEEVKEAFLEAPWLRGAIQSALLGE